MQMQRMEKRSLDLNNTLRYNVPVFLMAFRHVTFRHFVGVKSRDCKRHVAFRRVFFFFLRLILPVLNLAHNAQLSNDGERSLCCVQVLATPTFSLCAGFQKQNENKPFFLSLLCQRVHRHSCGAAFVRSKQLLAAHLSVCVVSPASLTT